MASQSKVAETVDLKSILLDLLVGSRNKKLITGAILLIIAFLLHIRNMNGSNVKVKLREKDAKRVKNMMISGWQRSS